MNTKPTYEELEQRVKNFEKEAIEHKAAQQALQISEQQLSLIFDSVTDIIYYIKVYPDDCFRFLSINHAFLKATGLTRNYVVGKRIEEVIPDTSVQLVLDNYKKAIEEKRIVRWEETSVYPAGEKIGEVSIAPVFNEKGICTHLVGSVHDITELKRLAAEMLELETQKRQLQKAESLGRMAGAIAHNFNNQIQVVIGNLGMAMNDQPRDSEFLAEALKAAHNAADISALMLTYSGKQTGKHEPIDLSAACRQSLTLLQAAVPKGTLLKADLPASGPVIRCNSGQIQQVIINLVTNAWESADESRRGIGLTVKTASQKDILAFKHFPADWKPQESIYACLEVADAGCGISDNEIEKIFDPFYTSKFTGRGMGLSVVLGIVKAHNGGITVESQPNRGSIFRVFFPLSAEKVTRQPDKPTQSSEIQDGGTVLLIEDEEQVRKMARIMLTNQGYRVIEAKDGIEALEIFQQHQDEIRCVLSDLTMPRMNGWDTLAALRKLSPDIPVILCSGYDEAQVMAEEHQERPNAFLGKPYRLQDLKDTMRHTLEDKKKA